MTFYSRYLEDVQTRLNSFHDNSIEPLRNGKDINDEVKWLSQGPNRVVKRYTAFIINGFRFHTKSRKRLRRTQNCGIVVNSSITSYASARDSNPIEGNVECYGLLTNIVEFDYYGKRKVVLFRCDRADVNTARGIKKDQFGFTMVNFSQLIHTGQQLIDEPYVFSSKVKQVFYSKNPTNEDWYVVLRNTPRNLFNMGNGSRNDIDERPKTFSFPEQNLHETIPSTTESGGRSKTRGHTLLKDLYELNSIQLVKVAKNSLGQPNGSKARLLAGYLGIMAQDANLLPINYKSWHHTPDSNKNQAPDNIKDRERVGTTSRQKQKFTHIARSKRFACVADVEGLSSGQKVGHLQLFDITHRKKGGFPMTTEVAEIMFLVGFDVTGTYVDNSVAFVGKAPLKTMFFSSVCGKNAARSCSLAAFVRKTLLRAMFFSGVCGKSAAKDHAL
ncbi:hypothetical protein PVK06_011718 [Gossypium arboreum]|uniref:DUF4216 domain-containing protein n=1 Tax=Gossypium arboreum TaxID=29729 RepID=A0ABR0QAE0_GOSAR|nr:hypothetical protein PVK06_011718 [Gossypium arboreum]